MYKVFFLEDNRILRDNLTELLALEGYKATGFDNVADILKAVSLELPDIVLLDVEISGDREAGFDACREIRRQNESLPIIFLSSYSSDIDKISGLRLGADDYLSKETSPELLSVRIRTLIKRNRTLSKLPTRDFAAHNADGSQLQLDTENSIVFYQGKRLNLTLTQFWIVKDLIEHKGDGRSVRDIMQAANLSVAPNTIAAHIKSIRGQFIEVDEAFQCIVTERGRGYRWIDSAD